MVNIPEWFSQQYLILFWGNKQDFWLKKLKWSKQHRTGKFCFCNAYRICGFSWFVRYQTEKKTKVLRLVPGKGPLKDCTSAIINLPPDPSQSNPVVTENEVITVPDGSEDSNVPDGLQDTASPCLEDESNNQPTGYLGDLFEELNKFLKNSDQVPRKILWVSWNSKLEPQNSILKNIEDRVSSRDCQLTLILTGTVCVDLTKLNKYVQRENHPLPYVLPYAIKYGSHLAKVLNFAGQKKKFKTVTEKQKLA